MNVKALVATGTMACLVMTGGCSVSDQGPDVEMATSSSPVATAPAPMLPSLTDVFDSCRLEGLRGAELGDGGGTLTVEMPAHPVATLTITADESACVAVALDIPDSVLSKISLTSPGDPSATESWQNVTVTWKLSDNGALTFIYEMD